jgi:rSAM/selenodomain-associated transferase 2
MISVIIPALNEERALPHTLQHLFSLPGDFEAILVDGGSTDKTIAIARTWPELKILASAPGRAVQMNAGAAAATGDMLLFLHADTFLPPSALVTLDELAGSRHAQWGGFHHRFSGAAASLRIISSLHNLRCKLTGVFYGDQAMFVRRSLFEFLGGFPSTAALEDIMLSESLLEIAMPEFLADHVETDSRKFEQMGALQSFSRCLLILISYELRLPILGQRFFTAIR